MTTVTSIPASEQTAYIYCNPVTHHYTKATATGGCRHNWREKISTMHVTSAIRHLPTNRAACLGIIGYLL
jgi:hypothetical protein